MKRIPFQPKARKLFTPTPTWREGEPQTKTYLLIGGQMDGEIRELDDAKRHPDGSFAIAPVVAPGDEDKPVDKASLQIYRPFVVGNLSPRCSGGSLHHARMTKPEAMALLVECYGNVVHTLRAMQQEQAKANDAKATERPDGLPFGLDQIKFDPDKIAAGERTAKGNENE